MPELQRQLETALGPSYIVERELGGGGMSRVFLAEETRLGRKVVIKLLAPEFAEGLSAERFQREILLAAGLQEPHIVPVIAAGVAAGLPYYTMPFIPGESLRAQMSRGTIPTREAVSILVDIASALEYAHERGIVHRDIKPENVLLSKRTAVVTDFGIAKAISAARGGADRPETPPRDLSLATLTSAGTSIGTPPYMSPEQIAGDPATDHRADLYALGVLAYEIFTGSTPFAGRTPTQFFAAIMTEAPPPLSVQRPDLPAALADLVMRLLAKDAAARPANAGEVLRALDDISVTGETPSTMRRGRRLYVAGAVGILLAFAGATYAVWSRVEAQPAKQADELWTEGQPRAIAVLPFANTSGDTANQHFVDGLTDELISALGRVPELRVMGRTSVFALRDRGLTVRDIAATLGVTVVLEGGVRRAGDRIKANFNLVRASDGEILWTEDFDRRAEQLADVFGVQEEIARAVVRALHARVAGNARSLIGQPTRDSAAYELYLHGKRNMALRGKEQLDAAATYFRRSTARDSSFALAFAALADVYVANANFRFMPWAEALSLAEAAADRAIVLDPSLGEAHASKGFVLASHRSFGAAEEAFRRAIQLNPSYPAAHHYYSLLLTMEGRTDDGLAANNLALRHDPLALAANAHRGVLLLMRGDREGARRALREALSLNAGFQLPLYWLGTTEAADGHLAEAMALLEKAHDRAPTFPGVRAALAYTYRKLGRRSDAEALLASLRAGGGDGLARIDHALGEAVLGDFDRAFAMLGKTAAWDVPSIINLRANPLLAGFRKDPRYGALLEKIGLEP